MPQSFDFAGSWSATLEVGGHWCCVMLEHGTARHGGIRRVTCRFDMTSVSLRGVWCIGASSWWALQCQEVLETAVRVHAHMCAHMQECVLAKHSFW